MIWIFCKLYLGYSVKPLERECRVYLTLGISFYGNSQLAIDKIFTDKITLILWYVYKNTD